MKKFTQKIKTGFTLIELLLVVAVIGILVTVVTMNYSNTAANSRDAQRQADLRNLQQTLEAYKNRHGQYPEQCTPKGGANGWSGQIGTDYECANTDEPFILGNPGAGRQFVPDFMPVLPTDPKLPSGRTDVGYVYTTNAEGSVYKIMAMNTVEADEGLISAGVGDNNPYMHPFRSCDMQVGITSSGDASGLLGSTLCSVVYTAPAASFIPDYCFLNHSRFKSSYALWGGAAPILGVVPDTDFALSPAERYSVKDTAAIVCK